jgi:outer membrane protein OmpA-like peptidoglycan-associated protein/tetratricopeptide (TPR) repeat protein
MKKINIIGLMLFVSLSTVAQLRQKVADKFYGELAYIKAVEYYEDLASSKNATTYQIRRTADCYYKLSNYPQAEKWFSKLIAGNEADEQDYISYFNILRINSKYSEASKIAKTISTKYPTNTLVTGYLKEPNYYQNLKEDSSRYAVLILKQINSKQSDFGATYYVEAGDTSLVFSSSRINNTGIGRNFQWDGSDFLDLYQSEFNEKKELKKASEFSKKVKSKYHEGPVSFSNNYTVMYLTRNNYLNKKKGFDDKRHNNLKLYITTKDDQGKWGELEEFPYNSKDYSLGHATVTEDGKIMYFVSDMPGGKGQTDIWMSTKEKDRWSKPQNLTEINTSEKEMFPSLNPTIGVLYFSSDGHVGLGGLDLYRLKLSGPEKGQFINMGYPLNTSRDDFSLITNSDETEGYFSSNRFNDNTSGNDDIFNLKINEYFEPKLITISEDLISNITKQVPLIEQKVVKEDLNFKDLAIDSDTLEMDKVASTFLGVIKDIESGNLLSNVSVTILNNLTGKSYNYNTNSNGEFTDSIESLNGEINYTITINKSGYLTSKKDFSYRIKESRLIRLNDFINIDLQKDKQDMLVDDFCGKNEILYDFNKSNIRQDAALELDKILVCMNNNPTMRIEIGSHTDCRGSEGYNKILAEKRAQSAMQYLIMKGIAKDRIFGKGYGEDKLKNDCDCEGRVAKKKCSEEEHQENRRTEFRIVKK